MSPSPITSNGSASLGVSTVMATPVPFRNLAVCVSNLTNDACRLKQPEEENANLKRLVADLSLDKAMLQDVLANKV